MAYARVIDSGPMPRNSAEASLKVAQLVRGVARRESSSLLVRSLVSRWQTLPRMQQIESVFRFVADRFRFVRDPQDIELIRGPVVMLRDRAGDCDDKAALLATLLRALGVRTRLVLARCNPADRSHLSHLYVEAWSGGAWVPLDSTFPGTPLGKVPTQYGSPIALEV